jgi:hypothetical protein
MYKHLNQFGYDVIHVWVFIIRKCVIILYNYLDQRSLSDFGRMSKFSHSDALECMEVFLVAYTCLIWSVIENIITKVRFNDESFMFWSKTHFCVK